MTLNTLFILRETVQIDLAITEELEVQCMERVKLNRVGALTLTARAQLSGPTESTETQMEKSS